MRHQKLKLLNLLIGILLLKLLRMPEGKPATVNFAAKHKALGLERSLDVINFDLGKSIIEANIGPLPMAFPDIDEPINIIFSSADIEFFP